MDERTERKKEQERTHVPLPESFPQPLEARGMKVKMLDKTKGEERREEEANKVLVTPREKVLSCHCLKCETRGKHHSTHKHPHTLTHTHTEL